MTWGRQPCSVAKTKTWGHAKCDGSWQ